MQLLHMLKLLTIIVRCELHFCLVLPLEPSFNTLCLFFFLFLFLKNKYSRTCRATSVFHHRSIRKRLEKVLLIKVIHSKNLHITHRHIYTYIHTYVCTTSKPSFPDCVSFFVNHSVKIKKKVVVNSNAFFHTQPINNFDTSAHQCKILT